MDSKDFIISLTKPLFPYSKYCNPESLIENHKNVPKNPHSKPTRQQPKKILLKLLDFLNWFGIIFQQCPLESFQMSGCAYSINRLQ